MDESSKSSGGNRVGGSVVERRDVDNDYANQVDPCMPWAQEEENYYATQDTDCRYRSGLR